MSIQISGRALSQVDRNSERYGYLREVHHAIAAKNPATWGEAAAAEAAIRLNWVDLPEQSPRLRSDVEALVQRFKERPRVVLCGMGGSSLAPEVLAKSFQRQLVVVDSTDPNYLAHALAGDLAKTVFVVSSKSGSTIETASQRSFFEAALREAGLNPIDHFVFVTDPDSPLDRDVRSLGHAVINADPNVGGRFSALSAFGIVPAALAGIDIWSVVTDAADAKRAFLAQDEVILDAAYLLSTVAGQYLAFTDQGSKVPGLADWIEQLIAESTGKDGKGRLPIAVESVANGAVGGAFTISFAESDGDLNVIAPLGAHFIFWEWVTAIVGAALAIDPFNQPNVTEAKEQTLALLAQWKGDSGTHIPVSSPDAVDGAVEIFGAGTDIKSALAEIIKASKADGYFAIMAYLDRKDDVELEQLRAILAAKADRPTTFGWGPRFLHSTGQFHKAGQPNGSFIQITGDFDSDLEIPGRDFTFGTLIRAQALGDGATLQKRKYPLVRFHCKDRAAGIAQIIKAANEL